jgi:hypothetical protein
MFKRWLVEFMVFNDTFNNISVISCRSVLLVEETGVPRENHWPAASHWHTLSHTIIFNRVNLVWAGFELTTLVVIGTDWIGHAAVNPTTIRCMYNNECLLTNIRHWENTFKTIFHKNHKSSLQFSDHVHAYIYIDYPIILENAWRSKFIKVFLYTTLSIIKHLLTYSKLSIQALQLSV